MNKIISTLAIFLCIFGLRAQDSLNITLLGHLDYQALHSSDLADIWGYVDTTGIEYAIVGADVGTSVVSLANPANPQEVFFEPGTNSIWRDIKTWGHYAYIVTEANSGLLIIDLTPLPGAITTTAYYNGPVGNTWSSAHNLYIDENGICYIFGSDRGNQGVIMLDLNTDPMNPVEVGTFDNWYVHDGMARGDTLYLAHINDGFFSVVDVSDKANPILLATHNTSSNFSHNVWVSDNGNYLYTTDEVSNGFIDTYDISDLSNITRTDKIQSNPGMNVIPHNVHFINNYIVTSYYRDGLVIFDAADPSNMVEVGYYDTSPLSGDGYNGDWGAYPWLPSGNIIISDIESGLFILGPTYTRGCYLKGTVINSVTTAPLNGVTIQILTTPVSDASNITGNYASGYATAGTYDVVYSLSGFLSDTAYNVVLTNGNITIQDMQLTPLTSFSFSGQVQNSTNSTGIPNAQVLIENNDFSYTVTADGSGNFTVPVMFNGTYTIYAGQWGFETKCISGQSFNSVSNTTTIQLDPGYYDDFTFDFNWTSSGNASTGSWVIGEPIGTTFGATQSNPDLDVQTDCYSQAYITGNGGGSAGTDDVDNGSAILTSPVMDLSTYSQPYIFLYRWWLNAGGFGTPDDSLNIYISNGSSTVKMATFIQSDPNQSVWNYQSYKISDYVTLTSTMNLIVETADWSSGLGNLVEAGLDVFSVVDSSTIGVPEISIEENSFVAYPNPFNNNLLISYNSSDWASSAELVITDVTGREVYRVKLETNNNSLQMSLDVPSGMYFARIIQTNRKSEVLKLIKK